MHVAFSIGAPNKRSSVCEMVNIWRSQMIAPGEANGNEKCRDCCRVPTASPPMGPENPTTKPGELRSF